MPAPSLKATRTATVLRWAIRGTGIVMAVGLVFFVILSLFLFAGLAFRPGTWGAASILFSISLFLVIAVSALFVKIGWDMYRKVNETSVANFSFLVALLLAKVWYRLLPGALPVEIDRFCREHAFLANIMAGGDLLLWSYRSALTFLAFFLFYVLIKAWVLQRLGLDSSNSHNPAPPDDREPIRPHVPFDPYQPSPPATYRPPSA